MIRFNNRLAKLEAPNRLDRATFSFHYFVYEAPSSFPSWDEFAAWKARAEAARAAVVLVQHPAATRTRYHFDSVCGAWIASGV